MYCCEFTFCSSQHWALHGLASAAAVWHCMLTSVQALCLGSAHALSGFTSAPRGFKQTAFLHVWLVNGSSSILGVIMVVTQPGLHSVQTMPDCINTDRVDLNNVVTILTELHQQTS